MLKGKITHKVKLPTPRISKNHSQRNLLCQIYEKQGHFASSWFVLRDAFQLKNTYTPSIMSAISNDNLTSLSSTWLLDSRVSHHFTPSVNQLPNATLYIGFRGIVVGNCNTLPISNV